MIFSLIVLVVAIILSLIAIMSDEGFLVILPVLLVIITLGGTVAGELDLKDTFTLNPEAHVVRSSEGYFEIVEGERKPLQVLFPYTSDPEKEGVEEVYTGKPKSVFLSWPIEETVVFRYRLVEEGEVIQ